SCLTITVLMLNLALIKEIFTLIRARYSVGLMTSTFSMPGTHWRMTSGSSKSAHTSAAGAGRVIFFSSSTHHPRCMQHGIDDAVVAGAAAKVGAQTVAHFFLGGLRILLYKSLGRHDHSWGAIPALQAP